MPKAIFIALVIACTLSSCIKAPNYSIIPAIKFVSVSSNYVKSEDRDTITFSFTDGDGDIGTYASSDTSTNNLCGLQHADSSVFRNTNFNIYLIDSRDSCVNVFASANIQPSGKYKGISGEMLAIQAIFPVSKNQNCFDPQNPLCPPDTVIYGILLTDMAGHHSNIVQTTPIVCYTH